MKPEDFQWDGAAETAEQVRIWSAGATQRVGKDEIEEIARKVEGGDDDELLALTARFDATERTPESLSLRVNSGKLETALGDLEPQLRESLELAIANVRAVATAQIEAEPTDVSLPQGQVITLREVPVCAAGIYAPGGRAAYPSSVIMGVVPARVAGVERVVLATPPGPDGEINPTVLATAALCEVDEVFALGGAQAIFALAYGSESIDPVNVIAGPGNAWVREAKRMVSGEVRIDSLAGPSELMVIAGHDADPEWIALDLCAQAEHGAEGPLLVAAVEAHVLAEIERAVTEAARARSNVADAPLALVQVPDAEAAIGLANAFAPEHLELFEEDAALLAGRVTTAGCVFVGRHSATAFGDYVAGSNHVLPTGGAGRFSGPLGPHVFRRRISIVEVTAEAAAKLAPHVDRLARAEGFPVHGESAMIRTKS